MVHAVRVHDIGSYPVTIAEVFPWQQLISFDNRFCATNIYDNIAIFDALDLAMYDLTDAVLILFKLMLAFSVPYFLGDNLLGCLSCNPSELNRRQGVHDEITDLRFAITPLRVCDGNLCCRNGNFFNHFQKPVELDLTCLSINLRANFVFGSITRTRCLLDCLFHRSENDFFVN